MIKKIASSLLFILFACALTFPFVHIAQAQDASTSTSTSTGAGTFVPLTHLPQIQQAANSATLPVFLNQLYKICIGVAAVLAVLLIMYAGVEIMTSRGSVSSNEKAKKHIQNAILGLILVLSPTIVFGIINPDILKLNIDVSGLKPQTLNHIDTNSAESNQTCTAITKTKIEKFTEGQDSASVCSAIGKGWAHYDSMCCSVSDASHICCGYDPKNDQNTPAPPPPESAVGNYTFDFYSRQQDYGDKDNGYCLMSHTYHYTTQTSCTTALNIAKTSTNDLYAVSDNCTGTLGQIAPKDTYNQISNLHTCQE